MGSKSEQKGNKPFLLPGNTEGGREKGLQIYEAER